MVSPVLARLCETHKPHVAYHCLPTDVSSVSRNGSGDFFYHLLVRHPEILKGFYMDISYWQKLCPVT